MDPKKVTAKLGNWQETAAMENIMGGRVFDPRIKSSSVYTSVRVVEHSNRTESKDYKSVMGASYTVPQNHRDFVNNDGKGPRERQRQRLIDEQIASEEKVKDDAYTAKANQRYMVTTTSEFKRANFSNSKLGSDPNAVRSRDPYYVKDAPITYYLHSALHGASDFSFPASSVGNLDRIWAKGSGFTSDVSSSAPSVRNETFENPGHAPTIRDVQTLKKLRFDIVCACEKASPASTPGGTIRALTIEILALDANAAAGRATVEAVKDLIQSFTGVQIDRRQSDSLVIAFSRFNDERIILIELIEYLRGSLSQRTQELVYRAFDSCNELGEDFISESKVSSCMSGSASNEAKNALLDSLHFYSGGRSDGFDVVDFIEMYRDVYAESGDDEAFEDALRSVWNI